MSGTVLVAEDDDILREVVLAALKQDARFVVATGDGSEAVHLALSRSFDLIIPDRNLPGLDGLSVLKTIRSGGVLAPVLFLTALGSTNDRVPRAGFGRHDYMAKPFEIEELLARSRALLRRPKQTTPSVINFGGLTLDLTRQQAS